MVRRAGLCMNNIEGIIYYFHHKLDFMTTLSKELLFIIQRTHFENHTVSSFYFRSMNQRMVDYSFTCFVYYWTFQSVQWQMSLDAKSAQDIINIQSRN